MHWQSCIQPTTDEMRMYLCAEQKAQQKAHMYTHTYSTMSERKWKTNGESSALPQLTTIHWGHYLSFHFTATPHSSHTVLRCCKRASRCCCYCFECQCHKLCVADCCYTCTSFALIITFLDISTLGTSAQSALNVNIIWTVYNCKTYL